MTILRLPLTNDLSQTFTCALGTVGTFNFRVYWNDRAQVWVMDIANAITSSVVINGLRLVCSQDLLKAYGYFPTFGTIVVIDSLATGLDPSVNWLTQGFSVVWVSPDTPTT